VKKLPRDDGPEIFGMHENANITFQQNETDSIIKTSLSIQPRTGGSSGSGKTPDDEVSELSTAIYDDLPESLSR